MESPPKTEIINVDQAIHLVEQVLNFLRPESEATHALVLALLHEQMAKQLATTPPELSRLAARLMSNPEFTEHLRTVGAQRLADRKIPSDAH